MPFSKTPIQSSFQTKPIPLLYEWETRNPTNNYDTDSLNTVNELVSNQGDTYFNILKRDGLASTGLTFSGAILGIFAPTAGVVNARQLVVVTSTNVYQCGYFAGVWSISGTSAVSLSPNTPYVGFSEFLFQDGTTKLYFMAATQLYQVIYGGIASIVPGIPTVPIGTFINPYPVFLDGYLFLCDTAGNIYNSQLNDPTTWPAANVATAESYPDPLKAIARVGSYLVAFGTASVEWFYDAANPTGTVLQVYVGATRHIGFLGGLVERADSLIFTGIAENGEPTIYEVSGLKAQPIQSFPYSRWSASIRQNSGATGFGWIVGMNGHDIYFYNSLSVSDSPPFTSVNTYGLDLDTKTFSRYTFQTSTPFTPFQGCRVRTDTGIISLFLQTTVVSNTIVRNLYQVLPSVYQDDGVNFPVSFTTRNLDFGTRRTKFGGRFLLTMDQTPSVSRCSVSWSVDDYQTFSTPRTVDVSSVYPVLYGIGMFKKIAIKLTYSDNFPMRFSMVEFDYDQGTA